ncbi:TetR/AcrR family transcriptional regulator [Nocardia paucivorans]|uniref:TetR/AcrR family transcriptional regulator n=1 Tax=Nocardia paucivorans TaxID=114259 RepID=UPI0002DE9E43|nr:TetR/AcrR family transcriptional regulator [Nocardia paucivorans]
MARPKNPSGPRAAMIDSAIELIRRRGVTATSFSDILAHSGAPRGSVYHHFPGGKAQLVTEATRHAADRLDRALRRALTTSDTVGALRAMAPVWWRGLEDGEYAVGCPIAAAALGDEDDARAVAGTTFEQWSKLFADRLIADGVPPQRAHSLAVLVISGIEGALVLARAQRSPAPIDTAVEELGELCRNAVEAARTVPKR